MAQLPQGQPVPADGSLPPWVGDKPDCLRASRFSVYVHVPFCAVRCGYCDFNTYTATELGGGASQTAYATTALTEVALARRVMDVAGLAPRPISTVFFGGGTPTMLPASDLVRILAGLRGSWGLTSDVEVTTEANPDSVTPQSLRLLAAGGFTRISYGMQSAVPHVLATLDRTHNPDRIGDVVAWARDAGLDVSLDLIYGTPGESVDDWRRSLDAAVATGVDHISAYALVVEPGTKMGAMVRRGLLPMPDDDDEATKYEIADAALTAAGLTWYEVSNWARGGIDGPHSCRHNLAYWRGDDWWGIGPGAHSYLAAGSAAEDTGMAGLRWWNVKHPLRYAEALERGGSPGAGRELLTSDDAALEQVMLGVRLSEGMAIDRLSDAGRGAVAGLVAQGLIDGHAAIRDRRLILTLRGRLLADTVLRSLT